MTSLRDASPIVTNRHSAKKTILVIFGTRPEAIKLCPLVTGLRRHPSLANVETLVCVTGQHREMLDQVLAAFDVTPDVDLNLMRPGQTLTSLSARLLAELEPLFSRLKPSLAVVQGDTTTTLCGALASFYHHVPLAHVEAGLRTHDLQSPFPEEMNRVVTGRLAALHFPATEKAAQNLRDENILEDAILVTGNTGIDAVLAIRDALESGRLQAASSGLADPAKKMILVTAHRRESFGDGVIRICEAIAILAARPGVQIIWPVHPNPNVQAVVERMLGNNPNVTLTGPQEYVSFVGLMRQAHLLITDSGGVQEEGPSLGKPILVLREKTERPEAVEAGTVLLVGTDTAAIVQNAVRLLEDGEAYQQMARRHNPYGDGHASDRIAERIAGFLT